MHFTGHAPWLRVREIYHFCGWSSIIHPSPLNRRPRTSNRGVEGMVYFLLGGTPSKYPKFAGGTVIWPVWATKKGAVVPCRSLSIRWCRVCCGQIQDYLSKRFSRSNLFIIYAFSDYVPWRIFFHLWAVLTWKWRFFHVCHKWIPAD